MCPASLTLKVVHFEVWQATAPQYGPASSPLITNSKHSSGRSFLPQSHVKDTLPSAVACPWPGFSNDGAGSISPGNGTVTAAERVGSGVRVPVNVGRQVGVGVSVGVAVSAGTDVERSVAVAVGVFVRTDVRESDGVAVSASAGAGVALYAGVAESTTSVVGVGLAVAST